MVHRRVRLLIVVVAVTVCGAHGGTSDLLFHSGRALSDMRLAAFAGAGSALPTGLLSTYINPALPHAYNSTQLKGLLSGLAYAHQAPVYDKHGVVAGGAYRNPKGGTVANIYRYLQGDEGTQTDYQVLAGYSGQLFPRSANQGAVTYGINVRYEQVNWDRLHLAPCSTWYVVDQEPYPHGSSVVDEGNATQKRLLLDLGFYQKEVMNNLDFGVVAHNLFGYIWHEERPYVTEVFYDSIAGGTDSGYVAGCRYVNQYRSYDDWVNNWYRRITVGVMFHSELADNKFVIRIPLDLEFVGLFERDRETHTMFRCGVEAEFLSRYSARFGYARQPWHVTRERPPENDHVFTGGVGVAIRGVKIDGFVGRRQWGVGVLFNY